MNNVPPKTPTAQMVSNPQPLGIQRDVPIQDALPPRDVATENFANVLSSLTDLPENHRCQAITWLQYYSPDHYWDGILQYRTAAASLGGQELPPIPFEQGEENEGTYEIAIEYLARMLPDQRLLLGQLLVSFDRGPQDYLLTAIALEPIIRTAIGRGESLQPPTKLAAVITAVERVDRVLQGFAALPPEWHDQAVRGLNYSHPFQEGIRYEDWAALVQNHFSDSRPLPLPDGEPQPEEVVYPVVAQYLAKKLPATKVLKALRTLNAAPPSEYFKIAAALNTAQPAYDHGFDYGSLATTAEVGDPPYKKALDILWKHFPDLADEEEMAHHRRLRQNSLEWLLLAEDHEDAANRCLVAYRTFGDIVPPQDYLSGVDTPWTSPNDGEMSLFVDEGDGGGSRTAQDQGMLGESPGSSSELPAPLSTATRGAKGSTIIAQFREALKTTNDPKEALRIVKASRAKISSATLYKLRPPKYMPRPGSMDKFGNITSIGLAQIRELRAQREPWSDLANMFRKNYQTLRALHEGEGALLNINNVTDDEKKKVEDGLRAKKSVREIAQTSKLPIKSVTQQLAYLQVQDPPDNVQVILIEDEEVLNESGQQWAKEQRKRHFNTAIMFKLRGSITIDGKIIHPDMAAKLVKDACRTINKDDLPLVVNGRLTNQGREEILNVWHANPNWLPARIVTEIGDSSLTARQVTILLSTERKGGRAPLNPDEREEGLPEVTAEAAKAWLTARGQLTPEGEKVIRDTNDRNTKWKQNRIVNELNRFTPAEKKITMRMVQRLLAKEPSDEREDGAIKGEGKRGRKRKSAALEADEPESESESESEPEPKVARAAKEVIKGRGKRGRKRKIAA
jgi:hypothetical protein